MNSTNSGRNETGEQSPEMKWRISRRGFLIGMAITGTALGLGIPLSLPTLRRKIGEVIATNFNMPGGTLNPFSWIEILPDNHYRLFVPKAELGQGTHTGLVQIVADELELPFEQLEVIHASSTTAEPKYRGTYGSQSILTLYTPLRQAAATMREMLREQAAIHFNKPPEKLIARKGGFEIKGDQRSRISYSSLINQKTEWQVPEKDVPLKSEDQFTYIGKPMPRIDILSKVKGSTVFGSDIRVKGMLYGAVIRPPTIGARLLTVRPGAASGMPGVVKVVIKEGFGGVVARSHADAVAARDSMITEWEKGHLWQQAELEKEVSVGGPGGVVLQKKGNARSELAKGVTHTAEYRTGFGAHSPLETQAAMADMKKNGGKIWVSTQSELTVAKQVAEALNIKPESIEVIPTYVGGGFGRKGDIPDVAHVAVEAAILSKATGKPVHVSWDRSEEMQHSFYRPLTHQRLSARLDANKNIIAIEHQQSSGIVLFEELPVVMSRTLGFDFGSSIGSWIHYDIPHRKLTVWKRKLPVLTGAWRGMGLFPNIFVLESFIDEMAHLAGVDPLRFRLNHLPEGVLGQRMKKVLNTAAEAAGWGRKLPDGHAQGIACCTYTGTIVAEVFEISADLSKGRINVHKVHSAINCGLAVNPNQVTAQVEGAIVMGTSAALLEEVIIKDGQVTADNFDQYPLLSMAEAPEVETIILEAPDGKPRGVGEPPIGPVGAAIGNAFFALTGKRLRQLPMTPVRVKDALKAS